LKIKTFILSLLLVVQGTFLGASSPQGFDFYGDTINIPGNFSHISSFREPLSDESVRQFYNQLEQVDYQPIVAILEEYRLGKKPDDWLFYQLIRRTAQQISPKADNYNRYTLYKWFLLNKLGYDAILSTDGDRILMYVRSDDNIYDIPYRLKDGKKYVCLNYHDYNHNIDFNQKPFREISVYIDGLKNQFSYKLTQLPEFKPKEYKEKDIQFTYADASYHFKVKMTDEVQKLFANYPVTDYQAHFNMPMSKETYNSLIPQLKQEVNGKSVKTGVNFLMHFTRYAFLYRPDGENFGMEKRLSPEQTLLYEGSDCEDRVALFFYLVKEIYNLPMIVLAYPDHVSIAVAFDEPVGKPVMYNGTAYTVCEPTPQRRDLPMGKIDKSRANTSYEIAYAYQP
jgi:hypothetical protein